MAPPRARRRGRRPGPVTLGCLQAVMHGVLLWQPHRPAASAFRPSSGARLDRAAVRCRIGPRARPLSPPLRGHRVLAAGSLEAAQAPAGPAPRGRARRPAPSRSPRSAPRTCAGRGGARQSHRPAPRRSPPRPPPVSRFSRAWRNGPTPGWRRPCPAAASAARLAAPTSAMIAPVARPTSAAVGASSASTRPSMCNSSRYGRHRTWCSFISSPAVTAIQRPSCRGTYIQWCSAPAFQGLWSFFPKIRLPLQPVKFFIANVMKRLLSRTSPRIELRHWIPGPMMAPDIRSRYIGGTASAIGRGHGRLRFPARRPRSRDCGRSPVNVEECRRGGIGLARHVVYGCARADQGLAGDPVVMAAQQQVHGICPLRCRRHDGPHHGLGRAAARPVLPVGPHGQLARVWRRVSGALAPAPLCGNLGFMT
jgi:hypothetical protein